MRFSTAYSRPTLTPLGQRLLSLSERKLYDIESPLGHRESGTALLRGVLVRETVRSAWSAVDEGREGGLSDWSQTNAMGLDVIGEDEEEVQASSSEDKWFDDLLSELGEEREADDWVPLATDESATVQVLPVYSDEPEEPTYIEYTLPSPESTSPPPSLPITPIDESTDPYLLLLDELDECEDLTLPPLLHRSWSSDSTESSGDSDECITPRLECAELEDCSREFDWEVDCQAEEKDEWESEEYSKLAVLGIGAEGRGVRLRGF